MKKNRVSLGLLVSLLAVGVLTFNTNKNSTLEVRDVLTEEYTNEVSGRVVRREANEVASNNLSNVKAQISSVTERGTRHIRFVAALDSYLYDEVSFTITANDGSETKTLVNQERVTTAYTHVVAGEKTLSASEAFGEGYTYLVAYTINNVPESAWGFSFSATVNARAEGYDEAVSSTANRVISEMAAIEDEMNHPTPIISWDEKININNGSFEDVFDGNLSTRLWFAGRPDYVDFDFGKEINIYSLEVVFQDIYDGYAGLENVYYLDSNSNEFVRLGSMDHNAWSMTYNAGVESINTSKIRFTRNNDGRGHWVSIAEFRYNFESSVTVSGLGGYYDGYVESVLDDNTLTNVWFNSTASTNAYMEIDLGKETYLKSLHVLPNNPGSGLPRVQYKNSDGEYVTLTETAQDGYKIDLRSENIYTRYIRLTTLEGQGYGEWINYKDILVNAISDDTPTLTLEGSCTGFYRGTSLDVFDGDDSTYVWNNGSVNAGDAYIITYPKPFDLKNLYVYYRSGIIEEFVSYDKIAYRTTTNNEWVDLEGVTFEEGQKSLYLDLFDNVIENVTQIKLYTTKDIGFWGGLATFNVNLGATATAGMQEYVPSTGSMVDYDESTFVSRVFDKDNTTYYAFGHGLNETQNLVIDLGQVRHLKQLEILFQHLDWYPDEDARFPYLEYSEDGVNYSEKIEVYDNNFSHVFSKTAHARYIRLSGPTEKWPSIVSLNYTIAY